MIPKTIQRAHVLRAIKHITVHGVPPGRSARKYVLRWKGMSYPPKYTVALAARFAQGELLDSEAFGGGRETNAFLQGLGFEVVSKGTTPPPTPNTISTLRVARVRLGLGMSMSAFRAAGPNAWSTHREVVEQQYRRDPGAYRARIRALIDAGIARDAQVVVLPACALVHQRPAQLNDYLRDDALIVAGALRIHRGQAEEFAVARRAGVLDERLDSQAVLWFGVQGYSVMAAISSTVAQLHEHAPQVRSTKAPPALDRPQLILDMGHHPYGSRYLFNTLRCLSERVTQRRKQPAITVLSSWRYPRGRMSVPWVQPEKRVTDWEKGEETVMGDTLDLMTLSFR